MPNEPQTPEQLRPCPFCGAENPLELGNIYEERFKFKCNGCKCVSPPYRTRTEAINGWNTRHTQPPSVQSDDAILAKQIADKTVEIFKHDHSIKLVRDDHPDDKSVDKMAEKLTICLDESFSSDKWDVEIFRRIKEIIKQALLQHSANLSSELDSKIRLLQSNLVGLHNINEISQYRADQLQLHNERLIEALKLASVYISYIKNRNLMLHQEADGTPSIEATINNVLSTTP